MSIVFSHHVLKPERVPLEAHPWGTPASSGSFCTLFESRLVRALAYKENPHDLVLESGKPIRVYGLSAPLRLNLAQNFPDSRRSSDIAYVTCGDASHTDLPDRSVDLVITDPPFMDNVHYSELADFFHSWLRQIVPYSSYPKHQPTTRQAGEVQSTSPEQFGTAIASVWRDCHRVLRDEGLLAFTFHQARCSAWLALMQALRDAGFMVTALQPIKAEMSTSVTKSATSEPSNLDTVIVCRKSSDDRRLPLSRADEVICLVIERLRRLRDSGTIVGRVDVTSVVRGAVFSLLTHPCSDLTPSELEREAEQQVTLALANLGL